MKPEEFDDEICLALLEMYKQELGGIGIDNFLTHPSLIVPVIQNPDSWATFPRYENKLGSKYSGDTKLILKLTETGNLEASIYLQAYSSSVDEAAIEDSFFAKAQEIMG
ncbi:MAG: hypothetical protein GY861_09480 [bacterium]|nr:hypothetical protein [bacterium]